MIEVFVAALVVLAVLAGAARAVTAHSAPARVDAAAVAVAALVPAAVLWRWVGGLGPEAVLGCVGLWFLWRVAAPSGKAPSGAPSGKAVHPQGTGRGASFYRLVFTAAALWITVSMSGLHHGSIQPLGSILQHMIAGVVLTLACAGWLLGTFAMPKDTEAKVAPLLGLQEALGAAAVALCFYSVI